MNEAPIRVGDAVTWNSLGVELFGMTGADGVVLDIEGDTAHILWSTEQETWATVSTLRRKGAAS